MSCCSLTSSATYKIEDSGDVNGDGKVTLADAVCIMQYLCGHHEPTDLNKYDVDQNGVISPMDAYIVQVYTLN
ncbi:MAG: dockerin type I repeat-containing protein [Ruminococcus flavefaciens]|nr:dockerin type I repeat-containing protein [Ruminococcus flavefaciens]